MPQFSHKNLLAGEPDASSFPNGGSRETHQARGNTIWDPRSHLIILKTGNSSTLRIPSIFVAWNGVSLDFKTPLLRSEEALERSTLKVLNKIQPDKKHRTVESACGLEQEFFLVNKKFYENRPDLIATGRSLLGKTPIKGQDHSDNYFSFQSTSVQDCIFDMERELWKIGIPNSTRHKEVAPAQYEMAPSFLLANQANDNNLIMMEIMKDVADKHDFACLLHEKPFANLNGSGKHNNWGFGSDVDSNFFKPKSPFFLVALAAFVRGVHLYGDLLRCSVSTSGNDFRLGGHEAPPGIMSIYLGDEVNELVEKAIRGEDTSVSALSQKSVDLIEKFEIGYFPSFNRPNSDRNRTSPIAFCGNRFELRAVGSSVNTAWSTTVLNTITADSMNYLAGEFEKELSKGTNNPVDVVVGRVLKEHQAVIFNGDNYSPEWEKEAVSRGLPNIKNSASAYGVLDDSRIENLFKETNVLSPQELNVRRNVLYSNFCLDVEVEFSCLIDLCYKHVLGSAYNHLKLLRSAGVSNEVIEFDGVSSLITQLHKELNVCKNLQNEIGNESDDAARALLLQNKVRPQMENVRSIADQIEGIVSASVWSLPTYDDMFAHH